MQLQVRDHLGIEQRDCVSRDRIAEAGMELLGHRGPANHPALFQHADLEPGLGKIGRADEAVVPPAND